MSRQPATEPTFHGRLLAVNVKVYANLFDPQAAAEFPGLTEAWIVAHLSPDAQEEWFNDACSVGWERANEAAKEAFGPSTTCYSEGRSAGWLSVAQRINGRPYPFTRDTWDEWDEEQRATWLAFADECRALADDTPYQYTWLIGANVFEPAMAAGFANLASACHAAATADDCRAFWGSAPYGEAIA